MSLIHFTSSFQIQQQNDKLFVVGDIGGTNLRLSIYDQNKNIIAQNIYDTQKISGILAALKKLIKDDNLIEQQYQSCCMAIAGPIQHDFQQNIDLCKLTNKNTDNIESSLEISKYLNCKTQFINDFEAIGYYILSDDDQKQIYDLQKVQVINKQRPICIIGAGTGLGFGFIVNNNVISSEGGHITFSPQNQFDFKVMQNCQSLYSYHVSWERILCGDGIEVIFNTLLEITQEQTQTCKIVIDFDKLQQSKQKLNKDITAKQISQLATQNEYISSLTMKIWLFYFGRIMCDFIAVFVPSQFYIAGGIMAKNINLLKKNEYQQSFFKGLLENGRTAKLAKDVDIKILLNESVGIQGSLFKAMQN